MKSNAEKNELVGRLAARQVTEEQPGAPADCPDPELVAAYIDGSLGRDELDRCESHFAVCQSCRQTLVGMARGEEALSGVGAEVAAEQRRWWSWRWLVPAAATVAAATLWVALRPAPIVPPSVSPAVGQMADATEPSKSQPSAAPPAVSDLEASSKVGPTGRGDAAAPATERTRSSEADARRQIEGKRDEKPRSLADRLAQEQPAAPVVLAPQPPVAVPEREVLAENVAKAEAPKEMAQAKPTQPSQERAGAAGADRAMAAPATVAPLAGAYKTKQVAGVAEGQESGVRVVRTSDPLAQWRFGPVGSIERSTDGGRTWKRQTSGVTATITAGSAPTPLVCWAVGQSGTILRTQDGSAWEEVDSPTSLDLVAVAARDVLTATVVASDGQAWVTADGGKSWKQR